MHHSAARLCILALASLTLAPADSQQPQPPRFRTGVDLLAVQAAVLDSDGRAVPDLTPSDFTVEVDGRPRKVVFARFHGTDAPAPSTAGVTTTSGAVSNASTVGGRVIVFVIDRDSIRSEAEKAALEAATSILDALTPADAVALFAIPAGGVELTRDHARVRAALPSMTGTAHEQRHLVAPLAGTTPARDPREPLWALQGLAKRLLGIRAPKHVILISGGLPFSTDLLGEYQSFARQAATAGLVLHAVHLDQAASDAGDRLSPSHAPNNVLGRPGDPPRAEADFGGRALGTGLTTIAGMTGGSYFSAIGRGTGVFDRIRTVITNFYELGVEGSAGDNDGKAHDLRVRVSRHGVTVRAREQVLVASSPTISADPLLAALQQPIDLAEMPLAVSTATTRGTESGSLRVLISADAGGTQFRAPAEWAYVVFDAEGKVAADGRQTIGDPVAGPWAVTGSAQLRPGRYRLKLAASDADRRVGALEAPLTVGLRAAGALQLSDLIVGSVAGDRVQPHSRIAQGAPLVALIEALSNDVGHLAKTRIALEVMRAGSAEPLQRHLMAARSGGADTILLNEARIETAALPPGKYTATAVALIDEQPVGRVSRAFEIVAAKGAR